MSDDSRPAPGVQEVRALYQVDVLPLNVLADSGPLIALFNAADDWHVRVVQWLKDHPETRLITTWPVLTEVCALLARRIHNRAALDFLVWVERSGLSLDTAGLASLSEVRRISQRFASLPFDLADASIAEAAARLGLNAILSIDADFDVYRDNQGRPLRNLLRS
ncbi:MAG: PIN domain-containing protein [Azonexus sp.]|jgi:predicted nucleic acid-binding protein|nr:PIN domain-containing protein [Azonexus sp.]